MGKYEAPADTKNRTAPCDNNSDNNSQISDTTSFSTVDEGGFKIPINSSMNHGNPKEKARKVCTGHLEACRKRMNISLIVCKEKGHKERSQKEWRKMDTDFKEAAAKETATNACKENEKACKNSVTDCGTKCEEKKTK